MNIDNPDNPFYRIYRHDTADNNPIYSTFVNRYDQNDKPRIWRNSPEELIQNKHRTINSNIPSYLMNASKYDPSMLKSDETNKWLLNNNIYTQKDTFEKKKHKFIEPQLRNLSVDSTYSGTESSENNNNPFSNSLTFDGSNSSYYSKSRIDLLGPDFTDSLYISSTEIMSNEDSLVTADMNYTPGEEVSLTTDFEGNQDMTSFCESTKIKENLDTIIETTYHMPQDSVCDSNENTSIQIKDDTSQSKLQTIIFNGKATKVDANKIYYIVIQNKFLENVYDLKNILPNVIECDLRHNRINSLKGIPVNTTTCNCAHNYLTSNDCHLNDITHLENLDISYNNIGPDLSFLFSCLHLRNINLSHNNITSLKGLKDSWLPLVKLNLSHNEIKGPLDFKEIIDLPKCSNLIRPNKQNKKITNMKGWLMIEKLDLSHNKISEVKNISLLPNLRVLNLDGNPIKFLQDDSSDIFKLEELSLKDTSYKLRSIQGNNYKGIPFKNVKTLKLDGFYEMSVWSHIPKNIENLEIKDTFRKCLPKWTHLPKNLKILRLENIKDLTRLPANFNLIVPFLEELYLPNNNLDSCHNLLSTIPTEYLKRIDLRGNPIAIKYEIENDSDQESQYKVHEIQFSIKDKTKRHNLYSLLRLYCPHLKTIMLRSKT